MFIYGFIFIYRYKFFFIIFFIRLGRLFSDKDFKYSIFVKVFVKRDINNVFNI